MRRRLHKLGLDSGFRDNFDEEEADDDDDDDVEFEGVSDRALIPPGDVVSLA